MIILEVGKEGVKEIRRMTRKSNDHGSFSLNVVKSVVISKFSSVDFDGFNVVFFINSNLGYMVSYNSKPTLTSIIRDIKISGILNEEN